MLKRIIRNLKKPNHTPKRLLNASLNFISRAVKSPYVLGLPKLIIIEPTNVCSLGCPLCPTGVGDPKRPQGFLSFENYKRIIDEIGDALYYVMLSSYGEPFLNPDIVRMIAYAKAKNIFVNTSTNAQNIDRACAERIVNAGLETITISADGATQESYERYKVGGNLEKVIDAVRFIRQARDARSSATPRIILQCVVTRFNEHELDQIEAKARRLGADHLIFKKMCDMRGFPRGRADIEGYIPANPALRAYTAEADTVRWNTAEKDRNRCDLAWDYPMIGWDGSVYPCCFDYYNYNMGNAFENGFKKIWNNGRFISLRARILRDKGSVPYCAQCPINFYGGDIIRDIYIEDTRPAAPSGYCSRTMADFYNYDPRFGAASNDLRESQYGIRDGAVSNPLRYFFFYRMALERVLRAIRPGAAVVDAGCGPGVLAGAAGEALRRYVGFDIAIERIRQARKAVPPGRHSFIVADACAFPLRDATFDTAVALELIEHVPDTEAFLREAGRVLAPGGTLIMTTPFGLSFSDNRDKLYKDQHIYEFSGRKLRILLEKSGFVVQRSAGIGFKFPAITIPVWLGSAPLKYLYRALTRRDLTSGYGKPIVLEPCALTDPLLNKLYYVIGYKRAWYTLMAALEWIGERVPGFSTHLLIVCQKRSKTP